MTHKKLKITLYHAAILPAPVFAYNFVPHNREITELAPLAHWGHQLIQITDLLKGN